MAHWHKMKKRTMVQETVGGLAVPSTECIRSYEREAETISSELGYVYISTFPVPKKKKKRNRKKERKKRTHTH
jgi:hypothetical protein